MGFLIGDSNSEKVICEGHKRIKYILQIVEKNIK